MITEDLISHFMYNTLTVRIYGMIKSKRPHKEKIDEEEQEMEQTLRRLKTKKAKEFVSTGNEQADKRIIDLEQ